MARCAVSPGVVSCALGPVRSYVRNDEGGGDGKQAARQPGTALGSSGSSEAAPRDATASTPARRSASRWWRHWLSGTLCWRALGSERSALRMVIQSALRMVIQDEAVKRLGHWRSAVTVRDRP